ncbi:MAG: ATP-dependent DNA ligase [Candidatus Verstraetearchaeota archaeon]|nr:ATP-dependent DNA ligase [Candidatus Verstraetearchaeota archaeon]
MYQELVELYDRLSATTKRLEMTDILVQFFKNCPNSVLDKAVYLTQGRLYPEFVPLELGVADRLIIKSIAQSVAAPESEVNALYKRLGDLGKVAESMLSKGKKQATLCFFSGEARRDKVTVEHVYNVLDRIARAQGEGSQEEKIRLLSDLLRDASPREAMYIVRTVSGAMRLGIADMTILDALAIAFAGSKDARESVERAYNMTSDLGTIAVTLATEGIGALRSIKPIPGRPVRPMLAERLSSPEEILEKMGGRCAVEYKYDGERVQIHRDGDGRINLFSRRLENINGHYPDVLELAAHRLASETFIVEGEIVAVDSYTGDMLPFQELMHRRRKYGVDEAMQAYPAALKLFDALLVEGDDLTLEPYPVRRERLSEITREGDRISLAKQRVVSDARSLENFFEEAISEGCEGLVAKSIDSSSVYKAGARGWLWIKYKRDYRSEMQDSVDLVAVGAYWGTGRRAGNIGTLLLAAYDPDEDVFRTVCKCSTGFSDEEIAGMKSLLEKDIISHKHPRVDSKLSPDMWLSPSKVLEVRGAEITLSPIHTCGLGMIRDGSGLAIRFPRFTGRWRSEKRPEDATTVMEIVEMYKSQLKKVS